jgi:hypothetical protein
MNKSQSLEEAMKCLLLVILFFAILGCEEEEPIDPYGVEYFCTMRESCGVHTSWFDTCVEQASNLTDKCLAHKIRVEECTVENDCAYPAECTSIIDNEYERDCAGTNNL